MKNDKIIALLQQAQITVIYEEKRDILFQLSQALAQKNNRRLGGLKQLPCLNCLADILTSLYWGCLNNCPEKLLGLAPVFMMLCGDLANEDSLYRLSLIDWRSFLENSASQE